jgi:hypothetical protein
VPTRPGSRYFRSHARQPCRYRVANQIPDFVSPKCRKSGDVLPEALSRLEDGDLAIMELNHLKGKE